jgi:hypothetical protein
MIQRIQTLYLLLAELLTATLLFLPFGEIAGKDGKLFVFGITGLVAESGANGALVQNSWPIVVVVALNLILLITIILQFKNRSQQIKLSYISILLLLGQSAIIYFYVWQASQILGGSYAIKLSTYFPLIAVVLVYLALKGISRDEKLVKSIDRIR